MSGYNEYSDLFENDGSGRQDGSGLRKQLEEALSEIRTLRSELTQEKRTKDLTGLLSEKGKDPAAAALIPQDADPKEWLDKYGAFLADAKKEEPKGEQLPEGQHQQGGQPQAAPEVPEDPALAAERAAMEQLQGASGPGTGIPSTASADPIQKMQSFQTEEELLNFIRSNGAS